MAVEKTKGIILKNWDYSETSKLVNFITPDWGQLRLLVKGGRRPESPFRGKLEIFNQGNIVFYPSRFSDLHLLSRFDLRHCFPAASGTLDKASCYYYFAELVGSASYGAEQSGRLYALFLHVLQNAVSIEEILPALIWFEFNFIHLLGVLPPLDRCSRCSRKLSGRLFFSPRKKGWLCPSCRDSDPASWILPAGVVAAMKYIRGGKVEKMKKLKLSPSQSASIRKVTRSLIDTHLGKRLKSLRFLEQIISFK